MSPLEVLYWVAIGVPVGIVLLVVVSAIITYRKLKREQKRDDIHIR